MPINNDELSITKELNASINIFGTVDIIPAMIINDIPLPIPLAVIWSPIHNNRQVPAVNTKAYCRNDVPAVIMILDFIISIVDKFLPPKAYTIANPCKNAIIIPKYLVIWLSFCLPFAPSFFKSLKYGMISICKILTMIEAEI